MPENNSNLLQPAKTAGGILRQYFVAVWTVGAILGVTFLLSPFVSPDISSLFLIAVMISAWRGGLGAGLLATLLAMLIDVFVFLPPTASLSMAIDNSDFVQLIVNVFAALVVGTLSASRRKAENERQKLLLLERSARIEAEKANETKDEFLAAVSHELCTPLTTIKTLTRLLTRKDPPSEKRLGYLEDIASECDRQIDFVHNLLDLSRIKAGGVKIEFERVNVEEVLLDCEKIEHVEANERRHIISLNVTPDLPSVRADRDALRRVVCTIAENAVKYTPDAGRIDLRAYTEPDCNSVLIEIADNGRGISEEDLPRIFESFYRGTNSNEQNAGSERDITGVGLGLYIARSLVLAMKGEIYCESSLGKGSTFRIRLPAWKEQRPEDRWAENGGLSAGSQVYEQKITGR